MRARRGWRTGAPCAPVVVVVLAAVGLLGGCTDEPDVDVTGGWVLVSGRTADGPLAVDPRSRVSLVFDDGDAGGKAPCNDYGSTYEVHGDELELTGEGGISMTLVGCEGADGVLEEAYLSALGDVDTVSRDGDALTLTSDDAELAFDRLPPWPRAAVVGHTWWLESWTDDSGVVRRPVWKPGMRPYLRLAAGGRRGGAVTASTGCRTMTGRWQDWRGSATVTRSQWDGTCPAEWYAQSAAIESVLFEPLVDLREGAPGPELVVRDAHGTDPTHLVYRR